MKQKSYSLLDNNQIIKSQYQEDCDAQRVYMVGGDFKIDIDPTQITNSIKEGLSNIVINQPSVPMNNPPLDKIEYKTIPINTIVKETEIRVVEIEKPVYITNTVIEKIEVPIIIKETEVKIVEVPVFMKENGEKLTNLLPLWVKLTLLGQSFVIVLGLALKMLR